MHQQQGMVHPAVVSSIVLAVIVLALGVLSAWSFMNYMDQKDNTDSKIAVAVADAKKDQAAEDEKQFLEREKQPVRQLVGPEDLGRITLDYPKTWSVYIDKDGASGEYQAYLQPGAVPALAKKTPYALHVSVVSDKYEETLASFQSLVNKGDLRAVPVTAAGQSGTRLDGNFSKEVSGAMVLFKLRDKTVKVATESRDTLADFNNIVLPSLKFNP